MLHHRSDAPSFWLRLAVGLALGLLLGGLLLWPPFSVHANPILTANIITWDVIGLDSNNVNVGPNEFPVAARVCNSGTSPATNVVATFVWESTNSYINLSGPGTLSAESIAPSSCKDFYFNVVVTRTDAAYTTARRYRIDVTADGLGTINTPTPRELYIEYLVEQFRNNVLSINGPSTIYLGGTYQFTLESTTATNGYEQLETFLNFPSSMFEILAVDTQYTAPAGGTNDSVYADACGWDSNPLSPTYRKCVGPANYPDGKAGGDITTTYTVRVVGMGTATLSNLIYDFSGSSYHYNADYDQSPDNNFTVTVESPLDVTKADALVLDNDGNGTASPGDVIEYTISIQNLGNAPITGVLFSDTPDVNSQLLVGTVSTTQGTVIQGNTLGDTLVEVNVGTLAAASTATITFRVQINNPLPTDVTQIANQGTTTGDGLPPALTDDPATATLDDPTITPITIPTAIELASFTTVQQGNAIEVQWVTSYEIDSWGFHLYRSTDGRRESAQLITLELIPAGGRSSNGASYSWTDTEVQAGNHYTYWLQEIEVDGSVNEYGPASTRVRAEGNSHDLFIPIIVR